MENCRSCGALLPEKVFLEYKDMPKSAQYFPVKENVDDEKGVDIILKQCLCCGLVQAVGEPVSYYRDVIRATGVSDDMRIFREKQFSQWVSENQLKNKRIIEIGCGAGEFMNFMKTTGADVYGLEHLRASVDHAEQNGLNVFEGFIENETYQIPDAPYDGFYIMNFLEHIPEPKMFLKGIANNLCENACGIVEVPNFDMMLKKSLYSEFIQDHLSYFTKDTLKNILETTGFEVIECENIWYDYIISAKVRKRTYTDISGFKSKHEKLKNEMHEFLEKQKNKGNEIAVWGAGHQALANLSLLNMSKYVKYVVDSAEFKQNKFTPATHLPIFSPEKLKQKDVQIVIIMGAGFSKEIYEIMENNYPEIDKVIFDEDGINKCPK